MKFFSTTVIAGIIAVFLTALVALLLKIPYFETKELQTADQMMSLRYHLQHKTVKPDSRLVLAGIDAVSLEDLGSWPFPRADHGAFLQLLALENPKAVGWDIFFTEAHKSVPDDSTAPAPDSTTPAPTTPNPPADNSAPAPAPSTSTTPAPPNPAPIAASAPTAAPASPADASSGTNAAPAAAQAPAASAGPADASSSTNAAPATAQAPAAPSATPESDDQALVDGASLFPHMVTAAEWDDDRAPLKDNDLLPTHPIPIKNVVGDISQLYSARSALVPFPALRQITYFGFANDPGTVRRNMPLAVNIGGEIFPSFDLQVLLQYWGIDPDQVVINLGHEITLPRPGGATLHIPIDEKACLTINYRARLEDFHSMSYSRMGKALSDKASNQVSKETQQLPPLKDNIVIVGVTFNGTDAGVTPLDDDAPLVATHLNTLNNILQQDFIGSVSPWIWIPVYALFLFGSGNLMLRIGIAPMIPVGFVCMLLVVMVGFAVLWFGNLQVPVFMPGVGIMLMASIIPTKRFFGEEREKQRVRRAMGAYLSEKVMNKVLAHPDNVKLGGIKQVITIMFCDIRGFTAYCDNRDSQEVLTVLNEYMEEMTQVVFKYDGTVDKYIGDCIMAFWNAPDIQADHAQRAVCCAMEMRYALANFKTKRAGKDVELFECGIGIHTGEALVGNMGSTLKLNYTAMGSTVNLGARLESLTKKLNERILISEDTRNLLEGEFPLTDRGEAMVPGFANPIRVFAVGADQDIRSALKIGRTIATQQEYTAEEVSKPIWEPAPLPEDADPNP